MRKFDFIEEEIKILKEQGYRASFVRVQGQ